MKSNHHFVALQKGSREQLFPGDIVEFPRNKYFSHFAVFYGERDGIPYVAHLTCRGGYPEFTARRGSTTPS